MEDHLNSNHIESEKDLFDSFDLERFWYVLKRSKFWLLAFILLSTSLAYVYVRYTKPVYRSESTIKLDFESEANVLGLVDAINTQERNEISGEIELIKSRLFLSKVAREANMEVSYHVYGRYLSDERYKNSPFNVSFKILNPSFYDRVIDLDIDDGQTFTLEYESGGTIHSKKYNFGDEIRTKDYNLLIQKTEYFNDVVGRRFYFTINSQEFLVDYLQSTLEVFPENFNAKTIKVAFSDFKPRKARDLVALVDSLYLDYTTEVKNQAIEQKIEFLDRQIEETEKRLSEYESYFEEFTIENRTTDLSQDLNRTIQQLALLDSQRFNLNWRLSELDLLDSVVKAKGPLVLNPLTSENLPNLLLESLTEYSELQQERELKLGSYNETSYVVQQINLKMDKADDVLGQLMTSYEETLQDRLFQLDKRRKILESNLSELPSMGTDYGKNKRFYDLHQEYMLSFQTSKMELEITRAGTVTRNVILSPASLPSIAIKPQKALIIAAGFMLGLIVSIVFLLTRYLAHNKIAGSRELERLVSLPLLGSIPNHKSSAQETTALVVEKDKTSSISEALRTIRTNLDFINGKQGSKIISVTSTVSGEGKTFVSSNLGGIMAMTGKKVCVVDLDMRKPKVHLAFGKKGKNHGVSTILAGKSKPKESTYETSIENLYFIPAGPTPPNPSELLLQEEFDKLLRQLSKEFDIIMLDTPPVGLVTDGRLIMKKSDIQIYIVRADYSKRSFTKVMNDLRATGRYSNMTTILNAIDNTPVYGYGYGYGYGYYSNEKSKPKNFATGIKSLF